MIDKLEEDPEKLHDEVKRLNQELEFLHRKLSFMIPRVRASEQIELDEFEIGAVITWHKRMIDKCEREKLWNRSEYHRIRAGVMTAVLPEGDDNVA
jgi:predicted RNase H-like nuclease (RuvC/YqgF family)